MPTDLTGSKIKDSYGQILHVDGGVTSTPKTVYDGDGTATALKVSTTDVQVNNSPVLTDADIGSSVQAYDADLTTWAGKTAPSGTVVGTSDSQALSNKTFSDNPTFSGGTANGVAYLNGSKVLTTGSALTFDGANLATGRLLSGRYTSDANNWGIQNYATNAYGSGIQLVYGGAGAAAMWVPAASSLAFGADAGAGTTEQMRLTNTGLGIGTSLPGYKLDVVGTVNGFFHAQTRNLSNGTSATASWALGNDINATAAAIFMNSSTNTGFGGTNSLNIYNGLNASIAFYTNGTKQASLDSSGNLGLGVTPSAWSGLGPALELQANGVVSAKGALFTTGNAYYNGGWKYTTTAAASSYIQASGIHAWSTAPSGTAGNAISFTQAMTLDASGNLLVGMTSSSIANVGCQLLAGGYVQSTASNDASIFANRLGSDGAVAKFYRQTVEVGSISVTGSATSYNTSSDYRLKENIQPMQNALAVVQQLNPVTYTWKADGSDGQGFIAHELQAVVPDCVTGEKDAVDKDGKPVYQGIDTSFLVATLTKAIQEQQEQINQLTARVAQLEGN